MAALTSCDWPGNIRELQNVIERAIILSNDGTLPNLLARSGSVISAAASSTQPTLKEFERDLILQTLQKADWIVGGANGAAVKLGVKRTTLMAKMKKLGISGRGSRNTTTQQSRKREASITAPTDNGASSDASAPHHHQHGAANLPEGNKLVCV